MLKLRHSGTGEEIEINVDPVSRSLYRFRQACRGLDRLKQIMGWDVYFVTLTLSSENLDTVNADLNKFLSWLRGRFKRAGAKFFYVWVVELQKKRYIKRGEKALHWHFAILCPKGSLPDVEFRQNKRPHYLVREDGEIVTAKEMFAMWGRGQVFSMLAYSKGLYSYLRKYFEKDYARLEGYNPEWGRLRRFGSSQLNFFKYPKWAFDFVSNSLHESPELGDTYIRKAGSRVGFYLKDGKELHPVVEKRSPWRHSV